MFDRTVKAYSEAIYDTDRKRALKVVSDAVEQGLLPEDIVFGVIIPSMESMMSSISEKKGINLAQHFMAAQIAAEVTEEMVSRFAVKPSVAGHVVIGTSQGDFHALGKRIVIGCLKARMIEVTDLGVNIPPEKYVEEAVAKHAQIIGISSMMVHTARGEKGCIAVRRILKERNLEDSIKIVVGGAAYRFDHNLYNVVQADSWAESAITAVGVIEELIRKVRQ